MSDEIPVETKPKSNLAALDDKDVAIANYIFYLLGPFNGITALLGFILALVKKSDEGTAFDNHFLYQMRSLIYIAILALGLIVLWPIGLGKPYAFILTVWWLLRAGIGLKYLLENKPLPNPVTWLV